MPKPKLGFDTITKEQIAADADHFVWDPEDFFETRRPLTGLEMHGALARSIKEFSDSLSSEGHAQIDRDLEAEERGRRTGR